jgi:hypothetical protein
MAMRVEIIVVNTLPSERRNKWPHGRYDTAPIKKSHVLCSVLYDVSSKIHIGKIKA